MLHTAPGPVTHYIAFKCAPKPKALTRCRHRMKLRQVYGPVFGNDPAEFWLYNHSLLNSEVKPKLGESSGLSF